MSDFVTLFSEPLPILFQVGPPDERDPGRQVLFTELEGKTIARRALADAEDMRQFFEMGSPLPIMYVGWHEDPGLQAQLFALTPDDSEAWKTAQAMDAHFLGTVVRAKEFMVHPQNLFDECTDHFQAILNGKTMEPIDQLLAGRLA